MPEPLTNRHSFDLLSQYFGQRPDMGLGKRVRDCVLEPSNPFDSKSLRSPKRCFVLLVLLAASGLCCFLYFNGLW